VAENYILVITPFLISGFSFLGVSTRRQSFDDRNFQRHQGKGNSESRCRPQLNFLRSANDGEWCQAQVLERFNSPRLVRRGRLRLDRINLSANALRK